MGAEGGQTKSRMREKENTRAREMLSVYSVKVICCGCIASLCEESIGKEGEE